MNNLARKTTLTILGALLLAPIASASFRLDVAGPHGRFSIGTSDYVEYGEPGAYSDYHAALEGYGRWIYRPNWGEVFVPTVDTSWRPYLYGRWIYSDYGLTWVSYEPWGYLPHHYGRWHYLSGVGWCWRPGYRYYAANVGFSYGGDYVGWWPAGCCRGGLNIDIDINIFITIVRRGDFMGTGLYGHLVAASRVPLIHAGRLPRTMPFPTRVSMEKFLGHPIASSRMQQRKLLVAGHAMTMPVPGKQLRSDVIKAARKVAVAKGPKQIGLTHRGESPRRTVEKKASPRRRSALAHRSGKLDRRSPHTRSGKVTPRKKSPSTHRSGRLDRRSPRTRSLKVAPSPHRASPKRHKKARPKKGSQPKKHKKSPSKKPILA